MPDARDGPDAPPVVVVNEAFVREHFAGEDAIGRRIAYDRVPTDESIWYEIVGVVGDQHQESPARPVRAEVFESRHQDWGRGNWIVMRTGIEPLSALPVVRSVLHELDPLMPISQTRTLQDVWRASMAREEFILTLLTIFGALALLLAVVGVYGVTEQAARRRTREIGIRMALGARAPDVLRLMLRQALGVIGIGLGIGLVVALFATRALRTLLYGIAPNDPATLIAVLGGFAVIACVASWVPARRAMAADPVRSLKGE
jgi:predicted lysophospholipase L1 biosynthesis ABC-type transport system permease subunit